ncbi:protein translocase subunit SecY [Streptomyces spiroverticillatus]|uniref:Protein translocase subunit SecY n=1 Tax=Streptomyces finlayi TaxID=67296 RepID=A0A918WW66_9ACTN|nr:preprotein translocase subunit SecY [Streptomyces finlayi]GHA05808.1 protein translocase subunit SecY [Streptomyces spiroverticillatus]GHC89571.1 protein translocase subunit SecY [Streptomyces finlayi]
MFKRLYTLPDVRRRLLVTLLAVVLFRLGQHLPLPGVDVTALAATDRPEGQLAGLLDLFTGGGLAHLSVLALGVVPVVAAHWVTVLAGAVSPRLRALAEAGSAGEARLALYARYVAVVVGAGLAFVVVRMTADGRPPLAAADADVLHGTGALAQLTLVACLTAGTAVVLWLSGIITRHGFGEGLYLLLFVQVAAVLPGQVAEVARAHGTCAVVVAPVVLLLTLALATVLAVTVRHSARRIPIQYAKRMIGRRPHGGGATYVPIHGGRARFGLMLAASLLLLLPAPPRPWLVVAYAVLVFAGAYVRGILDFDVVEVADKLKREGAFVPGIRPGRPTAEYFAYILPRITVVGALATTLLALLPVGALALPGLHGEGAALGVTGLLVVVLLALDGLLPMARQIESWLRMPDLQRVQDRS